MSCIDGSGKREVGQDIGDLGEEKRKVASLSTTKCGEESQEAGDIIARTEGKCIRGKRNASYNIS